MREELLWRMCNEHYTQGRHHETQRATTTQFLIAIAAALLSLVAADRVSHKRWIAYTLIVLGVFGVLFCMKQYERSKFHMAAAKEHRDLLELTFRPLTPNLPLAALRTAAENAHGLAFPTSSKWSLSGFYIAVHALIALLGLLLLFLVL